MPLIVAVIVYGGAFFGYSGIDSARDEIRHANEIQQHWLALKKAATDKVESETLKGGLR